MPATVSSPFTADSSVSHAAAPATLAALAVVDDPAELGRFTQWVAGPQGQRLGESSLQLSGMHCAACTGLLEQALHAVPGVQTAHVTAATQRATVTWDPERTRVSALIEAVRRAGYDAVPDAAAPARALRRAEHRSALWRLFVAAFCMMQVMMLATPSYVAGPGELAPDMARLLNWGQWVLSVPVLLFSSGPFFNGAWRALRQGRVGMDLPVALGVGITFVASTGASFDPEGLFGHEVFFDSMTMFVAFLLGARYLELGARHRAAESLESALARLPETAWRVGDDGRSQAVSVLSLRVGDRVRVPLGQAFPADAVLLQGHTRSDESLLSGESLPVAKHPGDEVVAGSINLGAPVLARVLRVGGDTRLAGIVSMMKSALGQRPAAARLADRWAPPFLWVVLLLAAAAAAVWSVIDPARAVWVAVSVLIVTCPCALSLAAPSALVSAARGLARRGILLQRLDAVETLARVDHVFVDKTGTLTEDRLALHRVRLLVEQPGLDEAAVRRMAASLAGWSSHPLSRALADDSLADGAVWREVQEHAGRGLEAQDLQGRRWRLGGIAWVTGQAGSHKDGKGGKGSEDAMVCLGVDGQAVAAFDFDELLREGSVQALRAFAAQGLKVTLLTGDAPQRAQALAARAGISDVLARATPEDKLAAVAAAQARGEVVAMVGDGINDAPVLARADVSFAMGQGALVARSGADAVLVSNRLGDIAAARHAARRTVRIVHQNLFWAASYNASAIPMALLGWLPPWAAGLGMALSSLLVIANAARAARPNRVPTPG